MPVPGISSVRRGRSCTCSTAISRKVNAWLAGNSTRCSAYSRRGRASRKGSRRPAISGRNTNIAGRASPRSARRSVGRRRASSSGRRLSASSKLSSDWIVDRCRSCSSCRVSAPFRCPPARRLRLRGSLRSSPVRSLSSAGACFFGAAPGHAVAVAAAGRGDVSGVVLASRLMKLESGSSAGQREEEQADDEVEAKRRQVLLVPAGDELARQLAGTSDEQPQRLPHAAVEVKHTSASRRRRLPSWTARARPRPARTARSAGP